jgi:hypothetical protein
MAPKESWKVCREIETGFTGHLPNIRPTQFAKPDGLNTTSGDEKKDILKITLKQYLIFWPLKLTRKGS